MQNQPLISFIVPVYNGERYIAHSVSSLQNQRFTNIEINIVDDGSTDNSPEICKQIMNADHRVHYIRKDNGGTASARNVGLQSASGLFIAFMDQDDEVDIGMAEQISCIVRAHNPNLILFRFQKRYKSTIKNYDKKIFPEDGLISGVRALEYFFEMRIQAMVWCGVFKKSIIVHNDLKFNEEYQSCDDVDFMYNFLHHTESVYLLPKVLYTWYIHDDSESHTNIIKPAADLLNYTVTVLFDNRNALIGLNDEVNAYCTLSCLAVMHLSEKTCYPEIIRLKNRAKLILRTLNRRTSVFSVWCLPFGMYTKAKLFLCKIGLYQLLISLFFIRKVITNYE